MKQKIRVGILGATGTVGQRFIQLLENHPVFQVASVAASDRSQGKRFVEACAWKLASEMPHDVKDLIVEAPRAGLNCDIVFSSLPGEMARETESEFRAAGYKVISNSSAFRMDKDVPLLIPEVNAEHLALLDVQKMKNDKAGYIVTNPNCSAIGLAMALAPLDKSFGLDAVIVTTLQAVSGAGYPGVASLDIFDNVIPFISGEEEKIEAETKKILGTFENGEVRHGEFAISAQVHRVPVIDGHTAAVRIKLKKRASVEDVERAMRGFKGEPQNLKLPFAPDRALIVRDEVDRPQPRLDRDAGRGMSVTVGRVLPDKVMDIKFVCLSHNTIRGAAGAAILNAELLAAKDLL